LQFDTFDKDIIIIPINHSNSHWCCAAVNLKLKRFEYYDSFGKPAKFVYEVRRPRSLRPARVARPAASAAGCLVDSARLTCASSPAAPAQLARRGAPQPQEERDRPERLGGLLVRGARSLPAFGLPRSPTAFSETDTAPRLCAQDVPQQQNVSDCGVFTVRPSPSPSPSSSSALAFSDALPLDALQCMFMESLSREVEFFDFSQKNMP